MKHKDPNNISKHKILLEGFKLFTSKSLSDMTFADLEKTTGLSRGAILYHFKTKDEIVAAVINKFILNKDFNLPTVDGTKSMWDNIENFVEIKRLQQDYFTSIGIENINRAYVYIAANGMILSKDISAKSALRIKKELNFWKELMLLAIERREINSDIDIDMEAQLFLDIYYGYSYMCMTTPKGYNLEYLLKQFRYMYERLSINS